MKKVYYLSTCDTCKRILKDLELQGKGFTLQDIKKTPISEQELAFLKASVGSYEELFSKRSQKYKALGLKDKVLSEADYKNYILREYTFLKRPVIIVGDKVFVGNSPKTVAAAKQFI
mgnify:CR=1 FL=1